MTTLLMEGLLKNEAGLHRDQDAEHRKALTN